jgi:hypothetical protein
VCCIAVTEVVVFRKLGGNEVMLRHFSLRQVKSPEVRRSQRQSIK